MGRARRMMQNYLSDLRADLSSKANETGLGVEVRIDTERARPVKGESTRVQGYYSTGDHVVWLVLYGLPVNRGVLYATLAHELGHAYYDLEREKRGVEPDLVLGTIESESEAEMWGYQWAVKWGVEELYRDQFRSAYLTAFGRALSRLTSDIRKPLPADYYLLGLEQAARELGLDSIPPIPPELRKRLNYLKEQFLARARSLLSGPSS